MWLESKFWIEENRGENLRVESIYKIEVLMISACNLWSIPLWVAHYIVDTIWIQFVVVMLRITIRGDADDDTVLCTKNQTYEVKAAETSNALLLLPNLLTPKSQGNEEINWNVKCDHDAIVSDVKWL